MTETVATILQLLPLDGLRLQWMDASSGKLLFRQMRPLKTKMHTLVRIYKYISLLRYIRQNSYLL